MDVLIWKDLMDVIAKFFKVIKGYSIICMHK